MAQYWKDNGVHGIEILNNDDDDSNDQALNKVEINPGTVVMTTIR